MSNEIPFAKAEAHGNDFLLVPESSVSSDPKVLAEQMCDRRRGIGADGLILYRAESDRFSMTLLNSDGSSAEISGNGLRCLAAYLSHAGIALGPDIEITTGAGRLRIERLERTGSRYRFRADMGPPKEIRAQVSIETPRGAVSATTLSMGNPHCVVFERRARLRDLGPALEGHEHFPNRTNVELVEVLDRHSVALAIWERGAGETASSGTGSSAAAVASIVSGDVESPVSVRCPGGVLEVSWSEGESVFLTGDAIVVAEGSYWKP